MATSSQSQSLLNVVFILSLAIILYASQTVGAISCVQCTPDDQRCRNGNMEPTECEPHHHYCGSYRVFMGSSQGVFRGCSRHWLSGCYPKLIDMQEYMVCYQSCSWNGCNANSDSSMSYLL